MEGWRDGRESGVKDCLQQSKMTLTQKGKPVQRYLQSERKTFFKLILVSLED